MCISAGASVSGVSWNTISIPSIVWVSNGALMMRVGGISVTVPREVTLPRPASTGQGGAELELRPPDHRRAGQHGLGDDLLHEAVRRPDLHATGAHVALVDDAPHATVVVGVTV